MGVGLGGNNPVCMLSRKIFLVSFVVSRGYGVIGSDFRSRGILRSPYIGGGWGNSRGHVLGGDVKL